MSVSPESGALESLASTSSVVGPLPVVTENVSAPPVGASFIALTVTVTVAVAVPPLPSDTV